MRRNRMLGSALAAMGALLVASGAQALPLLSEVYYDAPGTDDGQLFVELYGAPGTVLDGLFVEGINGSNGSATDTIALSGLIPADGIFVVADEASGGGTLVANADLLASFDFQNGPDSVVLRDDANVIDALGYGVFDPGEVFAGEGTPAPDVSAGSSLARLFADVDTDDNFSDWAPLGTPTPGQASLAAVPEPGAALLLALGLVGLASVGQSEGRPAAHA